MNDCHRDAATAESIAEEQLTEEGSILAAQERKAYRNRLEGEAWAFDQARIDRMFRILSTRVETTLMRRAETLEDVGIDKPLAEHSFAELTAHCTRLRIALPNFERIMTQANDEPPPPRDDDADPRSLSAWERLMKQVGAFTPGGGSKSGRKQVLRPCGYDCDRQGCPGKCTKKKSHTAGRHECMEHRAARLENMQTRVSEEAKVVLVDCDVSAGVFLEAIARQMIQGVDAAKILVALDNLGAIEVPALHGRGA